MDASLIQAMLARMGINNDPEGEPPPPPPESVLASFDLQGVADKIKSGEVKKVVFAVGAGISVSAGISDFRTPGTGLYDNLQQYNLPSPEAIFSIDYFQDRPEAFYTLAKEMWAANDFKPTPAHYLMKLFHEKDMLKRVLTQNIDSLEAKAGIPKKLVVAAHGNFDAATCIETRQKVDVDELKEAVRTDTWQQFNEKHGGLCKPDIVFFGESLPHAFFHALREDLPDADLLIVMGTSLAVQPFASCVDEVSNMTPRVLMNREKVGEASEDLVKIAGWQRARGFLFDGEYQYRDVFVGGDIDASAWRLASLLGWTADLERLVGKTEEAATAEGEEEKRKMKEKGAAHMAEKIAKAEEANSDDVAR